MPTPDKTNDNDPLAHIDPYRGLELSAFAPEEEVRARIEELEGKLDGMSDEDRSATRRAIDKAREILLDAERRTVCDAAQFDPVSFGYLTNKLSQLPEDRRVESLTMPPLSLRQTLMEGEEPELSSEDFTELPDRPGLELDFDEMGDILQSLPEPCQVLFER